MPDIFENQVVEIFCQCIRKSILSRTVTLRIRLQGSKDLRGVKKKKVIFLIKTQKSKGKIPTSIHVMVQPQPATKNHTTSLSLPHKQNWEENWNIKSEKIHELR